MAITVVDGMCVCSVAEDHRWPDDGRGQGCGFCAGRYVSSTNRLSTIRPDAAAQLDAELSSITADELSVGSNRKVWWRCSVDPNHPPFQRKVLIYTGGHKGNGTTQCPECRLVGTSVQELRLKAELATVLRIDPGRSTIQDADGQTQHVDILVVDDSDKPWLVLEFDGAWWHEGKERKDAHKAARLRHAGLHVVRIRESRLERLDPRFDVVVGFLAACEDAAADVLDHLAGLGLVDRTAADDYRDRAISGPQNDATAKLWILQKLGAVGERIERNLHKEVWARMYAALVDFEASTGHCYPSDGEVMVEGANLARWVRKQRRLMATGQLPAEREQRLAAIGSWAVESAYDAMFQTQCARYRSMVVGEDDAMDAREAAGWAYYLRKTRQKLMEEGDDLPNWKLEAVAAIPGWSWSPLEEGFLSKIRTLQEFAVATSRPVGSIKQREEWQGHPIGIMINSFRTHREDYDVERTALLEALPGWAWTPQEDTWNAKLEELRAWGLKHGTIKLDRNSVDEAEQQLERWKRNNKSKRQCRDDDLTCRLRALLAEYGEEMP